MFIRANVAEVCDARDEDSNGATRFIKNTVLILNTLLIVPDSSIYILSAIFAPTLLTSYE